MSVEGQTFEKVDFFRHHFTSSFEPKIIQKSNEINSMDDFFEFRRQNGPPGKNQKSGLLICSLKNNHHFLCKYYSLLSLDEGKRLPMQLR